MISSFTTFFGFFAVSVAFIGCSLFSSKFASSTWGSVSSLDGKQRSFNSGHTGVFLADSKVVMIQNNDESILFGRRALRR